MSDCTLSAICPRCVNGVAQVLDSEGVMIEENPCKWCNGESKFLIGTLKVDDLIDKLNDVKEKCDEIMEKLNE
jgi:hypothetical protein